VAVRIAATCKAEQGWRAAYATLDAENKLTLQFSYIHAWGLVMPDLRIPIGMSGIPGSFVPLSMAGHVLTEKEGFLGIVGPDETDEQAAERFDGTAVRLKAIADR